MKLTPLDSPSRASAGIPPLVAWLLVLGLTAVLLWPLSQGLALRTKAAQRRLDGNWSPAYRLLPLLGQAHADSLASAGKVSRQKLDRLWRELKSHRGPHPMYLWLELAWLEARAGHWEKARQALDQAQKADAELYNFWLRHKRWDPWRSRLGLAGP